MLSSLTHVLIGNAEMRRLKPVIQLNEIHLLGFQHGYCYFANA
jgi:hypothetical protein